MVNSIKVLKNIHNFFLYTICFFHFLFIIAGGFLYSRNIINIDLDESSTIVINCNNINLYNFISIINSFMILLTIYGIFELKMLGFVSNIIVSVINYVNLTKLDDYCINYYKSYHNDFWLFYQANIISYSVTNLLFLAIISITVRLYYYKKYTTMYTDITSL